MRQSEKSQRSENPKYFVLVSGVHEKCGTRIDVADPHITTRRALVTWVRAFTATGKLKLPDLVCGNCRSRVRPTHLLIGEVLPFKVRAIVPLTEVDRFNPLEWPDLPR